VGVSRKSVVSVSRLRFGRDRLPAHSLNLFSPFRTLHDGSLDRILASSFASSNVRFTFPRIFQTANVFRSEGFLLKFIFFS